MDPSDNFENPAWPPIVDEAYRPAFVHSGHIHRNRYAKPGPIANTTGIIVPQTQPAPPGASSNPPGGAETEAEEGWWKRWGSGAMHITLDVVGLVPVLGEPADLLNAAIYTAEGDYVSASISAAAAVPGLGWGAAGVKAGRHVNNAVDVARTTRSGADAATHASQQAARQTPTTTPTSTHPSSTHPEGGRVRGETRNQDGKPHKPCC